jgi:large conductance mechanosensitive channel
VLKDFKAFILRGNVVDLAVGVVIGAAFGAVVTALVKDLVTPLISIPGTTNFSNLAVKVDGGIFRYGDFLNALISFLLIATAVFFLVVVPVNALMARRRTETQVDEPTRECPECLSSIPAAARRCAFCTAEMAPSDGASVPTA